MVQIVKEIKAKQYVQYQGDVVIEGDIGAEVMIVIYNGSLTVNGNIGKQANITIESTPNSYLPKESGRFFNCAVPRSTTHAFKALGSIGEGVKIFTTIASVTCSASIRAGIKVKTTSGDIYLSNTPRDAELNTESGAISAGDVSAKAVVKTISGNIQADFVADNTELSTVSGDIKIASASPKSSLKTICGCIYEAGDIYHKTNSTNELKHPFETFPFDDELLDDVATTLATSSFRL